MIRALLKRDLIDVKNIHEKFYSKEFDFSEFNRFITGFVAIDKFDKIIVAGGVRSIAEAVIVTDKDASVETRIDALNEFLNTAKEVSSEAGYNQLHAFIQDDKWMRHLIKHGFNPTVGKSLVLNVKG